MGVMLEFLLGEVQPEHHAQPGRPVATTLSDTSTCHPEGFKNSRGRGFGAGEALFPSSALLTVLIPGAVSQHLHACLSRRRIAQCRQLPAAGSLQCGHRCLALLPLPQPLQTLFIFFYCFLVLS